MTYLNTDLCPDEYYASHSDKYINTHSTGISSVIGKFMCDIPIGRILDIGCGPGIATRILRKLGRANMIGVDNSRVMLDRYYRETGWVSHQANFWDKLPKAEFAVASYSLHLCPRSRIHLFRWRLSEAGIKRILVISPLKGTADHVGFTIIRCVSDKTSGNKTVWGWLMEI